MLGNLLSRLGFGGVPFLIPLLLQINLKFPADLAGSMLVPVAIGVLLSKRCSLFLLRQCGYKRLLMINTCFAGVAIWSFCFINIHTSLYLIVLLTFLYGFIISIQYSSINSLAYADIPEEDLSAATSIMGTIQQIAQSFGVAASALGLYLFSSMFTKVGVLTPIVFHSTFIAIGFITLLSILIFMKLTQNDGRNML